MEKEIGFVKFFIGFFVNCGFKIMFLSFFKIVDVILLNCVGNVFIFRKFSDKGVGWIEFVYLEYL